MIPAICVCTQTYERNVPCLTPHCVPVLRINKQEGMIKPAIDSVHELRDMGNAHRVSEKMHAGGKIVIRVRKPWERYAPPLHIVWCPHIHTHTCLVMHIAHSCMR
jgi:hypothetical protein